MSQASLPGRGSAVVVPRAGPLLLGWPQALRLSWQDPTPQHQPLSSVHISLCPLSSLAFKALVSGDDSLHWALSAQVPILLDLPSCSPLLAPVLGVAQRVSALPAQKILFAAHCPCGIPAPGKWTLQIPIDCSRLGSLGGGGSKCHPQDRTLGGGRGVPAPSDATKGGPAPFRLTCVCAPPRPRAAPPRSALPRAASLKPAGEAGTAPR